MLILKRAAVLANTPRNELALSTTIVWENPNQSHIFVRAATKDFVVDLTVASMAKEVTPQAAIK